jgi:(1->4)-alpha-D-glucan 1-alpha-D-glucosylmutase
MTNTPPASTYRLQLRSGLDLVGATEIVGYLHDLGVEWLYASPIARAAAGSPHGYDVVDPTTIDPALGDADDLARLGSALERMQMGLLLDVVQGHMRATIDNPWWRDQLEHGPASSYVDCFDIRWSQGPQARLVLPVLGRHYDEAIEAGELSLGVDALGLVVRYHEHTFPLDPRTWASVLERLPRPRAAQALAAACLDLPPRIDSPEARERRARSTPKLRQQLAALVAAEPELPETITRQWAPGDERWRSDDLHALLEAQAYRLAYWQSGLDDLDYRRFFDINELVALRMEQLSVFDAHHRLVLELVAAGRVHGVRVDHVDGLADPRAHLERLRAGGVGYVVVEKLLLRGEELQGDWDTDGTTGYDFIAAAGPLWVDPRGFAALEAEFQRATGHTSWQACALQAKREVLAESLAPALRSLTADLHQLTSEDPGAHDVSEQELEQALAALTAGLPVYRTYSRGHGLCQEDRAHLDVAMARARELLEPRLHCALEFIGRVLANELPAGPAATSRARAFVRRWQQLTGPATASGVEDTALYRYVPNLGLCEVGCEPVLHGDASAEFTAWAVRRRERMPRGLVALATHDTKRGQDVRARLYALTEHAEAYRRCREACKRGLGVPPSDPIRHEELEVLLQTMIGAWPLTAEERLLFPERLRTTLVKAARDAKRRTSWVRPDPAAELEIVERSQDLLEALDTTEWGRQLSALQQEIELLGAINGLAQLVLQLAAPGVCDVYQGSEVWDLSLADPDNRRPVAFTARRHRLATLLRRFEETPIPLLAELRQQWRNGRIKTHVLTRGLRQRRDRPGPFLEGDVVPVDVRLGSSHQHLQVLARRLGDAWVVAVVARRVAGLVGRSLGDATPGASVGDERWPLGESWAGASVRLPADAPSSWHDVLTGRELRGKAGALPVPAIFAELPVALLCAGP